jgi:hypothetical protein
MAGLKHTKNIYFAFWEEGTTLNYRIIVNADKKTKEDLYKEEIEGKFKLVKVLANE